MGVTAGAWIARNLGGVTAGAPGALPADDYGGPEAVDSGVSRFWVWTAPADGVMTWDGDLTQPIGDAEGQDYQIIVTDQTTSTELDSNDNLGVTVKVTAGHSYLIELVSYLPLPAALVVRASVFEAMPDWVQAPDRTISSYGWSASYAGYNHTADTADATTRVRDNGWYQGYQFRGDYDYGQAFSGDNPWANDGTISALYGFMDTAAAMFSHAITERRSPGYDYYSADGTSTWSGTPILNPPASASKEGWDKDGGGPVIVSFGSGEASVDSTSTAGGFELPSGSNLHHAMFGQAISMLDERRDAGPFLGYTDADLMSFQGFSGPYFDFEPETSLPTVMAARVLPDGKALASPYTPASIYWLVGLTHAAPADLSGADPQVWGPYQRLNPDNYGNAPKWWAGGNALPSDLLSPVDTGRVPITGWVPMADLSTFDPAEDHTADPYLDVPATILAAAITQEEADIAAFEATGDTVSEIPAKAVVGIQLVGMIAAARNAAWPDGGGGGVPAFDPGISIPTPAEGTVGIGYQGIAWPQFDMRPARYRYVPYPSVTAFDPYLYVPERIYPRGDELGAVPSPRVYPLPAADTRVYPQMP